MAQFDYLISVTGDCSNTGQGAISLFLTGGTPPYSIEWTTPYVALFPDTVAENIITNLVADTYVVRVNDSTLPLNDEFFINIPVSSGVCGSIITVSAATCNLDNGVVVATSTSLFSTTTFSLYTTDDEFITSTVSESESVEFVGLSADTYYLLIEDIGGCSAKTQSFIIEDSTSLDFGLYIVPNSSCGSFPMGKIFVTGLTGNPPFEYLWSNGQTGDTITGLTSGNYSVSVTDSTGCVASKPAVVVDIDPIGLGAFSASSPSCFSNNGSITLEITGGTEPYYYSASTGEFIVSYSKFFTINNLYAGQYDFLVKDAALCTLQVGTPLSSPTGISSVTISTQNSTCSSSDGMIITVVNGGSAPFTYSLISSGGTTNYSDQTQTYTFTGLSSGSYNVTVEDASGCVFSQDVTLFATDKFTINTTTTATTCNLDNGLLSITVGTGYTSPLDFSLDGEETVLNSELSAITFTNLSSGQHTVTVTDSTGCVQSKQVYLPASPPLSFSLYSTSCVNGNNGTITAFISSGTPPFTFDWSENIVGNPQSISVTGLTGGTYTLTITDSNLCTLLKETTITCNQLYTSYLSYVMGEETFNIESPTKCGLLQMLNDGFIELTEGNPSCSLVSAEFTAVVKVIPLDVSTSQTFFTTNSLQVPPSDDAWYLAVKTLLYTVPGVGTVTIDPTTDKITIQTIPNSIILSGQEIFVELRINYDIFCAT